MENLTHSLVGAAISHAALDDDAPGRQRRTTIAAGILAGNAPDLDLLYTWITPAPIGYLLHHRGHTHTIVGVVVLSVAITLLWLSRSSVRQLERGFRTRLAIVIGAGVGSHLALDAGNSYGVHPFYPADMRWYYGDSLFIFEPLLWLVLGGVVAMNARSRTAGRLLFGAVSALSVAATVIGIVPWPALLALAAFTGATALRARRMRPSRRAGMAIAGIVMFGVLMFGVSRAVRSHTDRVLPPAGAALRLDVALTPNPAFPLCWSLIAIDLDEGGGVLRLRRGSISLAPGLWPASACPLQMLAGSSGRGAGGDELIVTDDILVPLDRLRGAAADCRLQAWLRFVRAPVIAATRAYDLRFERPGSGNFTGISIHPAPAGTCPAFVPEWAMPRADAVR